MPPQIPPHYLDCPTLPPLLTEEDFCAAYAQGWTKTVRFLISRGVSPDTATEVAQDAWGKGWMKRDSLLKASAVIPWVNSIALNIFRGRIRRQAVDCDVPEQSVNPNFTPETTDIARMLESCDEEERDLLEATAAGYTSRDLAQIKGCKASTVRVRLLRLRRRLASRFPY